MRTLTDQELGWLAGMYEGEGSVFHHGRATQVSINSTDRDVVERLHQVSGIGNIHFINYTKKQAHWKDQWRWLVSRREDCREFLYAIYPLLGMRRRGRVDELREWLDAADRRYSVVQHGTYAGSKRCKPMCAECRTANNAYQREKYRAKHR